MLKMKRSPSVIIIVIAVYVIFFPFPHGCSSKMNAPHDPGNSASAPDSTYLASAEPISIRDFGSSGVIRPYKVLGKWYHPLPDARGFRQRGIASWYGEAFHGKKTSNGEVYDMNKISAAHKTLPLGTYVRVRNLKNNKTIDLRINDRGPFVAGRVIDLSKAAAKKLGVYGPGTGQVEVIALAAPQSATNGTGVRKTANYYKGNFTIQVGSFSDLNNAKKFWQTLDKLYRNAHITPYYPHRGNGVCMYRVAVGRCSTLTMAEKYEGIVKERGFKDAFMVAE